MWKNYGFIYWYFFFLKVVIFENGIFISWNIYVKLYKINKNIMWLFGNDRLVVYIYVFSKFLWLDYRMFSISILIFIIIRF